MNELTEKRTPEQIGAEIRMYVDVGRRVTLLCAIEIGRRLVEAKELLDHGEWLPWLERETEFSERSAQNYMKIFNEYGAAQLGLFGPETNTQTFADLPISKALALLSVPESDRVAFAEEVNADQISVRELEQAIRERDAAAAREKKIREERDLTLQDLCDLQEKSKEQEERIRELENRPVEVAVERDEEAIQAAAKEAREKAEAEAVKQAKGYEKQIRQLKKDLDAAETKRTEAVKQAENAGSDADEKLAAAQAETERIRAELEETQKKLKASSADVAKFGVWFTQVQNDFNRMMEALREVNERDPETGEKLKRGAVVLLKNILERLPLEESE